MMSITINETKGDIKMKKERVQRLGLLTFDTKKVNEVSNKPKSVSDLSFIVSDTAELLIKANENSKILHIYTHEGSIEEQKEAIKEFVDMFKISTNWVVITESYVSIYDYPEDEYYDDTNHNEVERIKNKQDGKKPVPFDKVLSEQDKMFKELGFLDLNFYVNYEYKHAWILDNVLGNTVVDIAKRLQKEAREQQLKEHRKQYSKSAANGCEAAYMDN